MPHPEISAAAETLKVMRETVARMNDEPPTAASCIKMNDHLDAIQSALLQIENRWIDLEKTVAWNIEASSYERTEVGPHAFVYRRTMAPSGGYLSPWYCPDCFGKKIKTVLRRKDIDPNEFVCPVCGVSVISEPLGVGD